MKLKATLLISALGIWSIAAKADTVAGSGGSLQSWNAAALGTAASPTYGGPYWNNFSGDGPTSNIGWCLTGTGGCAIANQPGPISYYGNGPSPLSNMYFSGASSAVTVSLLGTFTNQVGNGNGIDYFGWYAIKPDGSVGATTPLWNSTEPINSTTATFTPSANYGFYLENVQSPGKWFEADYFWFMNSTNDYATGTGNAVPGIQHFSVFSQNNGTFYLGLEDTRGGGDLDYNDMIIKLQTPAAVVPEPATIGLIGIGLALCGAACRKARRAKA